MADRGDRELRNWYKSVPRELRSKLAEDILAEANDLAAAIQAEAAQGATGNLKQSVRVVVSKSGLLATVRAGGPLTTKEVREGSGVNYDYALGQEFGNEHAPAQPFFYSTYRARREGIQRRLEEALARRLAEIA